MEKLIEAVKLSLDTRNWYSALIVVLTMPDIAGKIEYPSINKSGERYASWFNDYCGDKYKKEIGPNHDEHVFLNGNDCYALRCSYLHEGVSDTSHQSAHDLLENFKFVVPELGVKKHCNLEGKRLQVQVDEFCKDILGGIKNWLRVIKGSNDKQDKLNNQLVIYSILE
ncbi:hypothetical protein [Treponema endosymbiont of Eucomonympha sp.]|uniref:hypothetical protein n=1 Tax=Treponema endosymbiont of Eucomonympha sp. TaxID=1580831 RepID=UPI000A6CC317|nr:hypothetical protein [Treponema endosymbiont of Eucomonympha sp.]